MKNRNPIRLVILLILLIPANKVLQGQNSVALTCPPQLESLATQWTDNFSQTHPDIQISLTLSSGDQSNDLSKSQHLILTKHSSKSPDNSSHWSAVAGRDPMLFVCPERSKLPQSLFTEGITPGKLREIINSKESKISLYIDSNPQTIQLLQAFMGTDNQITGKPVVVDTDQLNKILSSDQQAICLASYSSLKAPEEIFMQQQVIPVDLNSNNKVDQVENIYQNPASFFKGIWIGKYPRSLNQELRLEADHAELSEAESAFANFVLTVGQADVAIASFTPLSYTEQISSIAKLPAAASAKSIKSITRSSNYAVWMVITLLLVLSALTLALSRRRKKIGKVPSFSKFQANPLSPESIQVPKGVLFDKNHTWSFMEQDGKIKVGIDDFLQHLTGPITKTQILSPGSRVKRGDFLMSLSQNGKKIQVLSPISGTIVATNSELESAPIKLNQEPFSSGWVCSIDPDNWISETGFLLAAADYKKWIITEFSKVKDFLSAAFNQQQPQMACLTLEDGGEIIDQILSQFGPETWEDFENQFTTNTKSY